MDWELVLGSVNEYLPLATGLLFLYSGWLTFALVGQRRAAERTLEKVELRLNEMHRIRLAEIENRIEALGQSQRTAWEEYRRDLAGRGLRWSLRSTRSVEPEGGSRLDKKHQVVSLAQKGLDSRDISRKLRLPLGETELLLGLWENFAASGTQDGGDKLQ